MNYYLTQFEQDLVNYCKDRVDTKTPSLKNLNDIYYPPPLFQPRRLESPERRIRYGTSGWEPENKLEFSFCVYFTILTDQAIYCHFPSQYPSFDSKAVYPKFFGMGFTQRLSPLDVLIEENMPLWIQYCDYFIDDWIKSLPSICDIDGKNFLEKLLIDNNLKHSQSKFEKMLIKRIRARIKKE